MCLCAVFFCLRFTCESAVNMKHGLGLVVLAAGGLPVIDHNSPVRIVLNLQRQKTLQSIGIIAIYNSCGIFPALELLMGRRICSDGKTSPRLGPVRVT